MECPNIFTGDPSYPCFFDGLYPEPKPGVFSSDISITGIILYAFPAAHDKIDISERTWIEENCFLAGVPPPIRRQDTLTMPFSFSTWTLIFVIMLITIIFLCAYTFISKEDAELSYGHWVIIISASVFQEHDDKLIYLQSNGLRLFFCIFFCMTFILTSSYAGVLVSFLSIPPKVPLLKTLEDIADSSLPLVQYVNMLLFIN